MRAFVRSFIKRFGYSMTRYPTASMLRRHGVNLILDVGANEGQFGHELHQMRYRGRLVSFEPMQEARKTLESLASPVVGWTVEPYALGEAAGTAQIHVSANSVSSSFLEMLPNHEEADRKSLPCAQEEVEVRRLDQLFDRYYQPGDVVFLKIDTQGFERQVLAGAAGCLDRIHGIQLEVSLVPLYRGQALIEDLFKDLRQLGFNPVDLQPMFRNPRSYELLQCDALFFRDPLAR